VVVCAWLRGCVGVGGDAAAGRSDLSEAHAIRGLLDDVAILVCEVALPGKQHLARGDGGKQIAWGPGQSSRCLIQPGLVVLQAGTAARSRVTRPTTEADIRGVTPHQRGD